MTDEEIAAIETAAKAGRVMVSPTRCWDCMAAIHPNRPHGWAGVEDVEHAKATGQPNPSAQPCGCRCADGRP